MTIAGRLGIAAALLTLTACGTADTSDTTRDVTSSTVGVNVITIPPATTTTVADSSDPDDPLELDVTQWLPAPIADYLEQPEYSTLSTRILDGQLADSDLGLLFLPDDTIGPGLTGTTTTALFEGVIDTSTPGRSTPDAIVSWQRSITTGPGTNPARIVTQLGSLYPDPDTAQSAVATISEAYPQRQLLDSSDAVTSLGAYGGSRNSGSRCETWAGIPIGQFVYAIHLTGPVDDSCGDFASDTMLTIISMMREVASLVSLFASGLDGLTGGFDVVTLIQNGELVADDLRDTTLTADQLADIYPSETPGTIARDETVDSGTDAYQPDFPSLAESRSPTTPVEPEVPDTAALSWVRTVTDATLDITQIVTLHTSEQEAIDHTNASWIAGLIPTIDEGAGTVVDDIIVAHAFLTDGSCVVRAMARARQGVAQVLVHTDTCDTDVIAPATVTTAATIADNLDILLDQF